MGEHKLSKAKENTFESQLFKLNKGLLVCALKKIRLICPNYELKDMLIPPGTPGGVRLMKIDNVLILLECMGKVNEKQPV